MQQAPLPIHLFILELALARDLICAREDMQTLKLDQSNGL